MKLDSILMILAICCIGASLYFLYIAEVTIQEVDCYDKKDNKILDLKCEKEVKEDQTIANLFLWLCFLLLITSFIVGHFPRYEIKESSKERVD